MSLSKKYFNDFIKNQTFVDLYTDCYGESFFCILIKLSDENILIETYDTEGRYDGILMLKLENINRVQWGGSECLAVTKLINRPDTNIDYEKVNIESVESALRTIESQFGYIVFETQDQDDDMCFIGTIDELDEDVLKLHSFGTRKNPGSGKGLYFTPDITKVSAGDTYASNIYNSQNKNS